MKHYMHLKDTPFQKIWNGNKTIELRLFDEKRRKIKVGDTIHFENAVNKQQVIDAEVIDLHTFDSFADLYKSLPLEKFGYTENEVNNASPADMNEYYSLDEQSKFGVVGIEFKVKFKHC